MINLHIPLCIDCDGTLIKTDLLHEAIILLAKQAPIKLFGFFLWLLKGKVYFKQRLSEFVEFNWHTLPYRDDVLTLIQESRKHRRQIVLVTASPLVWAEGIANHLGLFDEVIATERGVNLSGKNKAHSLVSRYGERGFDYAGNSRSDIQVWRHANSAIVVTSSKHIIGQASIVTEVAHVFRTKRAGLATYLKAIRLYQWLKNFLIFFPILAAHQFMVPQKVLHAGLGFLAFGLCASAGYIFNDLLDLDSDRQHIRKCKRPFAASIIPIWQGVFIIPLLLVSAFVISLFLPKIFVIVLTSYFAMTSSNNPR